MRLRDISREPTDEEIGVILAEVGREATRKHEIARKAFWDEIERRLESSSSRQPEPSEPSADDDQT